MCSGKSGNCSNAVYGLGFVGAAVYFWQNSNDLWEVVVGLVKAMVWPGILVYELLKYLL